MTQVRWNYKTEDPPFPKDLPKSERDALVEVFLQLLQADFEVSLIDIKK